MSEPIPFPFGGEIAPPATPDRARAFEIRRPGTAAAIREMLRLRYRAYVDQGYDLSSPTGEYRDDYDARPTTVMLGAYDGPRLVASMRLCFSFPTDPIATLPCAAYYPVLATLKRGRTGGLMEVSRLAIEPQLDNTSYRTTLYGFMVRSAFTAARAADVSTILAATKPDWVAYYKHLLGFEQIGSPAVYPPANQPITLLAGSLEAANRRISLRNRFFRITDAEVAVMRELLRPLVGPAVARHSLG